MTTKPKSPRVWRCRLPALMAAACWLAAAACAEKADRPVYLDAQTQKLAGIKTAVLGQARQSTEFAAYGQALSVQPLVELHYRYQLLSRDSQSNTAKYLNSKRISERYKNLYRYGIMSAHALQGRDLQMQVDRAAADNSRFQKMALADEARLQWGNTLTDWMLAPELKALKPFLTGEKILLKVILPADRQLQGSVTTIYVDRSGARAQATAADLVGAAPQTETAAPGESYFFAAQAPDIKPGMRLSAWIPLPDDPNKGVMVPRSALLWHMGRNLVYVKNDARTFSRRFVDHFIPAPDGYFVGDALKAGEEIVIEGAQLLLSEEFRGQIPDDDQD